VTPAERRWVILAVLIILIGVGIGALYRMGMVPLWASTLGTVMMAVAAIAAALIAARAYRNEKNG